MPGTAIKAAGPANCRQTFAGPYSPSYAENLSALIFPAKRIS